MVLYFFWKAPESYMFFGIFFFCYLVWEIFSTISNFVYLHKEQIPTNPPASDTKQKSNISLDPKICLIIIKTQVKSTSYINPQPVLTACVVSSWILYFVPRHFSLLKAHWMGLPLFHWEPPSDWSPRCVLPSYWLAFVPRDPLHLHRLHPPDRVSAGENKNNCEVCHNKILVFPNLFHFWEGRRVMNQRTVPFDWPEDYWASF